jgi:hypothetical protein
MSFNVTLDSAGFKSPTQAQQRARKGAVLRFPDGAPVLNPPTPQQQIAADFIAALTGSPETGIRLRFVHDSDRKRPCYERHGTLAELWPDVLTFQKEGYGTFIFVNQIKPGPGSGYEGCATDEDVERIRALPVDCDNGLPDQWHLKSSLVVRTSRRVVEDKEIQKGQGYYLPSEEVAVADYKPAVQRLAAYYKCDGSISNPSRVLRLPGSLHLKGEAQLVTFEGAGTRYSLAEILAGLPEIETPSGAKSAVSGDPVPSAHLKELLAWIDPGMERGEWIKIVAGLRASNIADGGEEAGHEMALAWSRGELDRGGRFKNSLPPHYTNDDDVTRVYDTMSPKPNGVAYGTVFEYAKNAGFQGGPYRSGAETFAEQVEVLKTQEVQTESSKEWPEPLDLWRSADFVRDAPLTGDMLPAAIAGFAADEAKALGVDLAMIALPSLAACATALHDNYQLQPQQKDTRWRESARLWFMCIAEPGGRKTPALRKATKTLHDVERKWGEEDRAQHAKAMQSYEQYKKAGLLDEWETGKPELKPRRLLVQDATTEVLGRILENNDRGILVEQDELAGWVGSFDVYHASKGKDRSTWLALWNGGRRLIDRMKDGSTFDIPNWSASVAGNVQQDVLQDLVKNLDLKRDGFLQRFQPFFGVVIDGGEDCTPDFEAIGRYETTVRRLLALSSSGRTVVTLSRGARDYWNRLRGLSLATERSAEQLSPLRNHASKWTGMCARLLLTFHAVESVNAPDYEGGLPTRVSEETAAMAYRLMTGYLIQQAFQVYEQFFTAAAGQTSMCRWIAGHLLAHKPERITARDLKRVNATLREPGLLETTMQGMEELGWVGPVSKRTVIGEVSQSWRVNPKIHDRFAEQAAIEKERRGQLGRGL